MTAELPKPGFLATLALGWYNLLEATLHLWVRSRIIPDPITDLELKPGVPVCYALDTYALSSLLIVDRCCRDLGLARPLMPLPLEKGAESRAYCAMRRKQGLIIRRTTPRTHSAMLKSLVDRVCEGG